MMELKKMQVSAKIRQIQNDFINKTTTQKACDVVSVLLVILIIAMVFVALKTYLVGRSLWADEAMLAESVITRSLGELFATQLLNEQSAPVLYLLVVKILTLLFGSSEVVLRLFTFIMYLGAVWLTHSMLSRCLKVDRLLSLTGTFLMASFPLFVYQYAHEFKPYMGDVFFVLLILYLYFLYVDQKINFLTVSIFLAVILWFSNPASFFVAAIMIFEFFAAINDKDYKRLRTVIIGGVIVSLSFIINYFWWLRPAATSEYMMQYWQYYKFNLFPKSRMDVDININLIQQVLVYFFPFTAIYVFLAAIGFITALLQKNKITAVVGIAMVLLVVASSLGKYPISVRMLLFFYVLIIIYVVFAINAVSIKQSSAADILVKVLLVLVLIFNNVEMSQQSNIYNLYQNGKEVNPLIKTIKDNVTEDEFVYVMSSALAAFKYKNAFNLETIGNVNDKENIILGSRFYYNEERTVPEELKIIFDRHSNGFLLFSYARGVDHSNFVNILKQYGKVVLLQEVKGTPLLYFIPDEEKVAVFLDEYAAMGN